MLTDLYVKFFKKGISEMSRNRFNQVNRRNLDDANFITAQHWRIYFEVPPGQYQLLPAQ